MTVSKAEVASWTKAVRNLQGRAERHARAGDFGKAWQVANLLLSSQEARKLAVWKVTQQNRGRDAAGVDNVASLTPEQSLALASNLDLRADPQHLRRVNILKEEGSSEFRPLDILTKHDASVMALFKIALDPIYRPQFSADIFGGPIIDSPETMMLMIADFIYQRPVFAAKRDIRDFYKSILPAKLMEKLIAPRVIKESIAKSLSVNTVKGDGTLARINGIAQGSPISQLLGNIMLMDLHNDILGDFTNEDAPRIFLYVDDILILHHQQAVVLETTVRTEEWLSNHGLSVNTKGCGIRHSFNAVIEGRAAGFDFLRARVFHSVNEDDPENHASTVTVIELDITHDAHGYKRIANHRKVLKDRAEVRWVDYLAPSW